ncbi:putative RNA-directed RNA polymerase (Sad-1) [Aspergillus ellipticus CBS 707.79]|uniref:RNA-dependent RNA polymerase n=1 Tax=Aspergillus ellipticus CBS 707.79 TaxID=1448320 RepID=A0A319DMI5_9EURO|nr:putative RNA-directed RNA polymerase (Sad-1) [Aspergillus ellipticus CBS 707.79]
MVPRRPSPILAPWKLWESVVIRLNNVPLEANAQTIWQALKREGHIFSIDLFEDSHGQRVPRGKVRFKPPPTTDFWRGGTYTVTLPNGRAVTISIALEEPRPSEFKISSPVRPNTLYPTELKIPISSMSVGVMLNETTLMPMKTLPHGPAGSPFILLDLRQRSLFVYFQLQLFSSNTKSISIHETYESYRVRIPLRQMSKIFQTSNITSGLVSQITILDSPPLYHRRIRNLDSTFIEDGSWRDWDCWYRQTYIISNPMELSTLPISLQRQRPLIDIGRWNAFRFNYPGDCDQKGGFSLLCNILQDYNISIEKTDRFIPWNPTNELVPPVWKWIDLSETSASQTSSSLDELIGSEYVPLPFSVRYQLEVCISNGYLSEFTMTREFALKLAELGETQARKLLEHVATQKQKYVYPMKIFDLKFIKGVTDAKIPAYCCHMRAATITPSTIYYNMPSVDISNRIVRRYMEHVDRFLRVRFTDEKLYGRIHATNDNTNDEIFTRIKRALANGIVIGDRRYEFLAFGNSQFREHGAYFFAPLPDLTAANIRAWMGRFDGIRNVAKYAARLGQCFSTTRAIAGCPVQIHNIGDVERNGYTFSDGVGKISRFLAQMAMTELKIKTPTGDPPSAFQFRLGGCKGMLAVSSDAQPQEVHIRKSQTKFTAFHNGLEIIRWSQFSVATLNRQLILVLSTLGIPDAAFHLKLKTMLRTLNEAMENDSRAIEVLKKYVDPNQTTLTVSQMVSDGFRVAKEPFITSILALWRTWHLKYLKEKAKIIIDKGANLLGVMDETGLLKGHFNDKIPQKGASVEEKLAALPEIFLQISRPESQENGEEYEVIEGLCIMARNPSLHPGDIRVVRAVNIPELRNLYDVVVLPQTGDQDIASMCSGGDLDGDDYLVIWDKDLIPNNWFREPMKYTSNKARDLDHDVTVDEITSFFVMYMKNDSLPTIAHAHVAWADWLEYGVNEEKCIRLAQLHSDAVDYNKTGSPAIMTRSLHPRMWPHFMEKMRSKDRTYHSGKILGQLYDAVERVDFAPSLEMPFDERIINCQIEVSDELHQFAKTLKTEYDSATRRIMAQHEIKTEFEVWSTFVLGHSNMSKDYKFHENIGFISTAHRELFKKQCYNKVGGRTFDLLAPLAAAMYRITHEEMSAALKEHRDKSPQKDPEMDKLPLISFSWLFPHILGRIARGLYDHQPATVKTSQKEAAVAVNVDSTQTSSNSKNQPQPPEDPFGLFTGEEQAVIPQSTQLILHTEQNTQATNANGLENLDQLLDFGFTTSPRLTPPSLTVPSITAGYGALPLLDLVDSAPSSEESMEGEGKPDSDLALPTMMEIEKEKDGYVEIVEEGDVEPTALDKLNELLGL